MLPCCFKRTVTLGKKTYFSDDTDNDDQAADGTDNDEADGTDDNGRNVANT